MYSVIDYDPMLLESSLPYPKTLDETVLIVRAQDIPKLILPENAGQESVIGAGSGCMKVAEAGGMEAAAFYLSHSTELDPTSEHGDGSETHSAEEQGPDTLTKPDGNGRITEQQHEGFDSGSPLKSPAVGTDKGANAKARGEKKRKKRSKNWSDEETEILLKAVPQKKKIKSRFDKGCDSEPFWEGIAKEVQGRTGKECRMRMETLTKSYKAIKEYCDNQKMEFMELKEDFEDVKLEKPQLATRLRESWYNHIRDHCPPKSNKKMKNQGAGSSTAIGVPVLCASSSGEVGPLPVGFQYSGAESIDVVTTTPDSVTQSSPPLEASEVVRGGNKISETLNRRLGELLIFDYRSETQGAGVVVWILSRCGFDL